MVVTPLSAQDLRLKIDPETLGFERLSELSDKNNIVIGQDRAIQALTFGLRMEHPDFNIYVAGPSETGVVELARTHINEVASSAAGTEVLDWCYVHNFKDPDCPIALGLPRGRGREFKNDMDELVKELKIQIPQTFEGESYLSRKEEVIRAFNNDRNEVFKELEQKTREEGFILQVDQSGMMVLPAKEDGSPLTADDVSKLTEEEQQKLKEKSDRLQKDMGAAMRRIHKLEKGVRKRLKDLDRELASQVIDTVMEHLREGYGDNKEIIAYLDNVREDIVNHIEDFRPKSSNGAMPFPFPGTTPSFTQYEVNVLVDNSETSGAPVIEETNPSYPNLFGTVERKAQFGALFTDFTMIKPGALHRANGGYLLLKAIDLLKRPFTYEALKRCLRNRRLEIEDAAEQFGLFATKALKPRPIPLNIKIVLTGDPVIYHLLYNYDEDFRELFKVKAHLDDEMDFDEQNLKQFLMALRSVAEREGLRDIHATGAARLVEYASELAESREKLSLKIRDMADLMREANYWAEAEQDGLITEAHVQKAIDKAIYRSNLYEERLQELLKKETIKVATTGSAAGQVNGLAIYDLGDYSFGKPSRITANISLGKEGVVNIEREADLSGKTHTKGVMILAGYLRANFAGRRPLTLTASVCFEQSYGMVEGDSASGAELFALLSALSNIPIKQGIAVTGAVSQKGEILPVGGVTRKIEGFYELCAARGLTGDQGVIIPRANVRDLTLKQKVVEAVKQKKFNIWAVERVEEGMEILTGVKAGSPGADGTYPEGTIFHEVDSRLESLAEEAKNFMQENRRGQSGGKKC